MLVAATVQVPQMLFSHQAILQNSKSGGKIWSPNKLGSMDVNIVGFNSAKVQEGGGGELTF